MQQKLILEVVCRDGGHFLGELTSRDWHVKYKNLKTGRWEMGEWMIKEVDLEP